MRTSWLYRVYTGDMSTDSPIPRLGHGVEGLGAISSD